MPVTGYKMKSATGLKLQLLHWVSVKVLGRFLFILVPFTHNKHLSNIKMLTVAGDQTGITSTLDLCSPEQHLPRHLLLPMHMPAASLSDSLSDQDRQYLASKGVFTLPGKEACDSLIRAYFRHVHPIMPIIEADGLLGAVAAGRFEDYNVLLVWSVFFAAVNVGLPGLYLLEPRADEGSSSRYRYARARATNPGKR